MALKLTSTMQIPQHINVLCYGESGIGKTTLIKTAPAPLILSAEGGLLSLADEDIPVFEIKDRKDLNEAHEWLSRSAEAQSKYKTICIDSLSEIAEVLLAEEKENTKDTRMAYGTMAELMTMTIRGYRDLPYHTYFTAKVKKVVEEATGVITYMPSVPGQILLSSLPYFFDFVLRMDIGRHPDKTTYRYLQTTADRRYVAKDRSGKLSPQEEPNLQALYTKILRAGIPMTKPDTEKTKVESKVKVLT